MKSRDLPVQLFPGRGYLALLVLTLGLILSQRLFELRFQTARSLFRWVSGPVHLPFRAAHGLGSSVSQHFQETDDLRERLAAAEARAAEAETRARLGDEARLEAERLKRALAARGETEARFADALLFAHVVGGTATPLEHRITLDRGAEHGVVVDSPVIYGEDVLGRVVEVHPSRCRVLLINDPLSAIGVHVEGSRSPGVAQGNGGPLLDLTNLPEGSELPTGALVLTGSLSAYYPKGLVVGVLELDGETPRLRPRRDLLRLEEAFVLPVRRPSGNQ